MISTFRNFLMEDNLSDNTIKSYTYAIDKYFSMGNIMNKNCLLAYKSYLSENYKAKTVNLRIQALNKYLEYTKNEKIKLKFIKIHQKKYLENVISNADYEFFKHQLIKDNKCDWYFVVKFLGATGARVSELVEMKVEHVFQGYTDLYTKGGKLRRIYIAKKLQLEALKWLKRKNQTSGFLFTNRNDKKLSTRGVAHQLKQLAIKYQMNPKVIYPHSFRHRFAKNFLEKYSDIALLADLMGHESIETTRIYLRRTCEEQQEIVNRIITW